MKNATEKEYSLYEAGKHAGLLEQAFTKLQEAYNAGNLNHTYQQTLEIAFTELGDARVNAADADCAWLVDQLLDDYLLGLDTFAKAIPAMMIPSSTEIFGGE